MSFLLEHGSNPLSRDNQGWHAIHWASAGGHADCIKTLLDKGAKRDCITNVRKCCESNDIEKWYIFGEVIKYCSSKMLNVQESQNMAALTL